MPGEGVALAILWVTDASVDLYQNPIPGKGVAFFYIAYILGERER